MQVQNQQPSVNVFDTKHDGMIHDAQYDYYGKRLATCSTDGHIHIYDVQKPDNIKELANFKAHNAPIWKIAWAHPRFGSKIASCSYDYSVSIWQETQQNKSWELLVRFTKPHQGSVNSVQWASWEFGFKLASCSSDGHIAIFSKKQADDPSFEPICWEAHTMGVNAICWQPYSNYDDLFNQENQPVNKKQRLASASCDKTIKIWEYEEKQGEKQNQFKEILTLQKDQQNNIGHTDWVRDVAWSPCMSNYNLLASCSEDFSVIIWKIYNIGEKNQRYEAEEIAKFSGPVWRVSWSLTGNTLAVSYAGQTQQQNNENLEISVKLFREDENGKWVSVQQIEEQN